MTDPDLALDLDTAARWPSGARPGLTVAELYILQQRGVLSGACWTLDDVAVLLGVSAERVRQLEQKALSRLAASTALKRAWLSTDEIADDRQPSRAA